MSRPSQAASRLPALTGVRGVAALWVVAYHFTRGVPVIERGALGVDLFFMLSGFILSYAHDGARAVRDWRAQRDFLKLRLARIYPLYAATLLLLGLYVLADPGFADSYPLARQRWGLDSFVASLLLVQNWGHFLPTCWNTPAWSLSAEWFAYLGFPLFQRLTRPARAVYLPLLLAAGCLAGFVAAMVALGIDRPDLAGTPGMARVVSEFAAGCLLFTAWRNGLPTLGAWADAAALLLLAIAVLAGGRLAWIALPGFALVLLLGAQGHGAIARALAQPPLVWLGKVSYSLYLTHWIVLQIGLRVVTLLDPPRADAASTRWLLGALCLAVAAIPFA